MSGEISSDKADSVYTLSVILPCFLFLQWMFVLFLVFWLRKTQQRVNKVHKEWRVCSNVTVDIALPLETETDPPAAKNGYSFPLVISNMRAVNSNTDKSWKKIDRTFAYAQSDHEEDENQRDLEGAETSVEQEEDNETQVDSSTSQETALPNISKDTSCRNIVDERPAVLFLAGERPDENHGEKGIFMTLNGHAQFSEGLTPAQKERSLVLIDAENLLPENQEECTWFTNGTFEMPSPSKETCILELEKQSIDEKPSAEYSVPMDQNKGQSTSKAFHAVKKNNADGNIDGEKLTSEGTSRVTDNAANKMPRREDESTMPRHEDESKIIIPTATEPKEKQKQKHKERINRQYRRKRKVSGERAVPPPDNIQEDENGNLQAQHVDKLDEDERKNAVQEMKFQQAEQYSGTQDEISQCVEGDGHVNRHAKASSNVPVNQCNGRFTAEVSARMESIETTKDSYDCIPTVTEPKVEKQKHKQKKRINKQYRGKCKVSGERAVPLQDNIHEDKHGNLQAQYVDKLVEDDRKNAVRERKFQQAEQHSRAQDEISEGVNKGRVSRLAKQFQNRTDMASSNVPVNHCNAGVNAGVNAGINAGVNAERGAQMKSNETVEDNYDCIDTREQWKTESPGNMNCSKFGDDGDPKETKQDVQNMSDEIYSNIDGENNGFKDTPTDAHPGYVNCKTFEYVDKESNDDSHIYANADKLQQESVMFNDNLACNHADEGPIYVNLTEIMDV